MSKIAPAILAIMLAASPLVLPQPAIAENGEIAAGVVGGLIGGALLGGALASRPPPPPPAYYAPAPVYYGPAPYYVGPTIGIGFVGGYGYRHGYYRHW